MRRNASTAALLTGLAASLAAPSQAQQTRANPAAWPKAASPSALTSAETEAMIDAVLARMTIEQKVGQLIQADISAINPEDLERYPLGSILAGGNSGPYGDERASGEKWRQLVDEFRAVSRRSGAGIPILFGVDAVHGHSNLPGATVFPHNVGLGATHDPALIQRIGAATAAEISGSGIEWTFAPTLAAPQDLRWGRAYEGYSSSPALIASYAKAMTLGLQGPLKPGQVLDANRVAATAKHFLADGGTQDGRDQGDARITEKELVARHAQGYPAAISAGALTVMASFSSWNGAKNHGNASLLTDVLKGRMGFAGLIVGDWNGHGQVAGCTPTDCPASINAGLDLFMAPDSWKDLYTNTLAAARDGRIAMTRIDDAVRRNLRVKAKLGLLGDNPTRRGNPAAIGSADHLALAREAVARSLVLLKNERQALPLRPGAKVLVTGPGADSMAMQAGGWTITWQGADTSAADFPKGQTIGRAIAGAVSEAGGSAVISPEGSFAAKPDVAVVVMGERPYAEFEGDVPDLAFRAQHGEEALIARLKAQGIKVVVVFLSGRPMFTGKLINQADAFVAAWLPGSQGQGVADVLVAGKDGKPRSDFAGRLSFAWPADARSPVKSPLFPLGYGASYAKPRPLGRVNEDPRLAAASGEGPAFMIRGKVPAPWHLGSGGLIASRAVDLGAQEDARQFAWSGTAPLSIEGTPKDLVAAAKAGQALMVEWRIDGMTSEPVKLGLESVLFDLGPALRQAGTGKVIKTMVPLRCFGEGGVNLGVVGSPLRIEAASGFVATIRTVAVVAGEAGAACPR